MIWPSPGDFGCILGDGIDQVSQFRIFQKGQTGGGVGRLRKRKGDAIEPRAALVCWVRCVRRFSQRHPNWSSKSTHMKWLLQGGRAADGWPFTLKNSPQKSACGILEWVMRSMVSLQSRLNSGKFKSCLREKLVSIRVSSYATEESRTSRTSRRGGRGTSAQLNHWRKGQIHSPWCIETNLSGL